jgi:hypothetical protein
MRLLKKFKFVLIALLGIVLVAAFVFSLKGEQSEVPVAPFITTPEQKSATPTLSVPQTMTPQQVQQQTQDDIKFSDGVQSFLKDYPWYTKLPIDNSSYRIVYDLDKSSFRIRLKISSTSPKSQQDLLIARAIQDAKSKGIDIGTNYYILFGN